MENTLEKFHTWKNPNLFRGIEKNSLNDVTQKSTLQIQELEENKPPGVKIKFDDPNTLSDFQVIISPEEGYWAGGRFRFHVKIPLDYNMSPPDVTCLTKLWHPNISVEGAICLSLLRPHSLDGLGWAPTRWSFICSLLHKLH